MTDFDVEVVQIPGRARLAVRRPRAAAPDGVPPGVVAPIVPFLLVHGLASNARLWDGVAGALAAAGSPVTAVDLRSHGTSEQVAVGHTTQEAADDVAALLGLLGWQGRAVVAGQSWGGNVVLAAAARHVGVVAGLALIDGGWIRLRDRFATFEECWQALEPPRPRVPLAELSSMIRASHPTWPAGAVEATVANLVEDPVTGLARNVLPLEHHRSIVASLWEGDPALLYPLVEVPVTLLPAGRSAGSRAVDQAAQALTDSVVRPYPDADHDVHGQHPTQVAADLLELARRTAA